jgi:hypothetical protein
MGPYARLVSCVRRAGPPATRIIEPGRWLDLDADRFCARARARLGRCGPGWRRFSSVAKTGSLKRRHLNETQRAWAEPFSASAARREPGRPGTAPVGFGAS